MSLIERGKCPAFPDPMRTLIGLSCEPSSGITTRQYFAAKAMQGLLAQSINTYSHYNAGELARDSLVIADAMLQAESEGF